MHHMAASGARGRATELKIIFTTNQGAAIALCRARPCKHAVFLIILRDSSLALMHGRNAGRTLQSAPSASTLNSACVVYFEPPTKSSIGSLVTVRAPSAPQVFCCVSRMVSVLVPGGAPLRDSWQHPPTSLPGWCLKRKAVHLCCHPMICLHLFVSHAGPGQPLHTYGSFDNIRDAREGH